MDDEDGAGQKRVWHLPTAEAHVMFDRWLDRIAFDPAYNRNLSLTSGAFEIETSPALTWDPELHPVPRFLAHTGDRAGSGEYRLIAPLRARADLVIDTSHLSRHDLRRTLQGHFALDVDSTLAIFVVSFSYRHGIPREADLVFDARFLANPHYDPALRPLSGTDAAIGAFIDADPGYAPFFHSLTGLIEPLLPRFRSEGKSYLTIAIGCTGGQHRSVYLAEQLALRLRGREGVDVVLRHRELEGGGR